MTTIKHLFLLLNLLSTSNAIAGHELTFSTISTCDTVTTTKVVSLTGDIDDRSRDRFLSEYFNVKHMSGPLYVFIDSVGGHVRDGAAMILVLDAERQLGNKVICVVDGKASSMAFNTLTHCTERYATIRSKFVVHPVASTINCATHKDERRSKELFERCTAKNLRVLADSIQEEENAFSIPNATMMHLSLDDYELYADNERTWLTYQLIDNKYLNDTAIMVHIKETN